MCHNTAVINCWRWEISFYKEGNVNHVSTLLATSMDVMHLYASATVKKTPLFKLQKKKYKYLNELQFYVNNEAEEARSSVSTRSLQNTEHNIDILLLRNLEAYL